VNLGDYGHLYIFEEKSGALCISESGLWVLKFFTYSGYEFVNIFSHC
jgi:hypothetical protein